jgi:hypothetical protein
MKNDTYEGQKPKQPNYYNTPFTKTCINIGPRGVGQSVTECVVKELCDVKVTSSKPAGIQNPTMLRVGVSQAGCDPRVILTA